MILLSFGAFAAWLVAAAIFGAGLFAWFKRKKSKGG